MFPAVTPMAFMMPEESRWPVVPESPEELVMPVMPVRSVILVQSETSVQSMVLVVPAVPTLQETTQLRND